jgi:hypothetical protein
MKCQSDFDKKNEDLQQADECVTEWWDGKQEEAAAPPKAAMTEAEALAEAEAIRRGLVKVDEKEGLCMSCPETTEKDSE